MTIHRALIIGLCLLAAGAAAGCGVLPGAVGAGKSSAQVWDVVPGQSAGPIKIGMKSIDVHRTLGVPTESKSGMREIWQYKKDLAIAFDMESRVFGIQMLRPGRVQWKGRWLDGGATGKDAVSAFGDPDFVSHWTRDKNDSVEYIVYGYRLLGFGVLADPKTDRIVGYIITTPEGAAAEEGSPPPPPGTPPPPP